MVSPERKRPPEGATADAMSVAVKGTQFDSRSSIPQLGSVELIVRDRGRVLCMTTARAVRNGAGLHIAGFRIPAAVLP